MGKAVSHALNRLREANKASRLLLGSTCFFHRLNLPSVNLPASRRYWMPLSLKTILQNSLAAMGITRSSTLKRLLWLGAAASAPSHR